MSAWYYYRGKLEPVLGEHPGVIGAVYRGKARVRYHEDLDTLAVQAGMVVVPVRRIARSMVRP